MTDLKLLLTGYGRYAGSQGPCSTRVGAGSLVGRDLMKGKVWAMPDIAVSVSTAGGGDEQVAAEQTRRGNGATYESSLEQSTKAHVESLSTCPHPAKRRNPLL